MKFNNQNFAKCLDIKKPFFFRPTLKEPVDVSKDFIFHFHHMVINEINNRATRLQLFGTSLEGHSVFVYTDDFLPSVHILCPDYLCDSRIDVIQRAFEDKLEQENISWGKEVCWDKMELVQKRNMYGFQANEKRCFLKMYFKTFSARRQFCKWLGQIDFLGGLFSKISEHKLKKFCFKPEDDDIPNLVEVLTTNNWTPERWLRIKAKRFHVCKESHSADPEKDLKNLTTCQINLFVESNEFISVDSSLTETPVKIVGSYDIETMRSDFNIRLLPDSKKENDVIICIALSLVYSNDVEMKNAYNCIFFLKTPEKVLPFVEENSETKMKEEEIKKKEDDDEKAIQQKQIAETIAQTDVFYYDNETLMILDFFSFIKHRVDLDILTGWKIWSYDNQYIWDRLANAGISQLQSSRFLSPQELLIKKENYQTFNEP